MKLTQKKRLQATHQKNKERVKSVERKLDTKKMKLNRMRKKKGEAKELEIEVAARKLFGIRKGKRKAVNMTVKMNG